MDYLLGRGGAEEGEGEWGEASCRAILTSKRVTLVYERGERGREIYMRVRGRGILETVKK